ncbi:MAG: hypothetical protein IJQ34_07895 [Kiritimatiellae bacterium]|nr:hypothetical protein [Kiritimatiellia bacterium]
MNFLTRALPYIIPFCGAFLLTFILTPIVREINRRLGMVDKPGERRINTIPVPRGGGLALVIGVIASFSIYLSLAHHTIIQNGWLGHGVYIKMAVLSIAMALVGYTDDKYNLNPKIKLIAQLIIAALAWGWADLGFRKLWPSLPAWLDCAMTIFWIAGAVNAFNLIDGLDGLASGLAFIATIGMGGALFMVNASHQAIYHFAFAGGLLAFLKYNYHPASVFLGDCGSMFIGFTLSILPLATEGTNSFLVSVGVPLLAMGVPIFDTALAIIRRSIRHMIKKRNTSEKGNDKVMTADSDHIHHRILRSSHLNQRRAAWILYAVAFSLVAIGLFGMALESRAAGLWLFAISAASFVIFKDMARIELFDAGRFLNAVARDRARTHRRRIARLAIPFYIVFDILALIAVFFFCYWVLRMDIDRVEVRVALPIRVISVFLFLYIFKAYKTVWSRAMTSNYVSLLLACIFGTAAGSIAIYYAPTDNSQIKILTLVYATTSAIAIVLVRLLRGIIRDIFYAIDCSRLKGRKDVSRVLVYGCGLRYRAFLRELVRTTSENNRIIVGLIDDDILLRGHYIGGIQVLGTLAQTPEIINAQNVDSVVIAFDVTPEWLTVIKKTLGPLGVKITHFSFNEKEILQ